MHKTTFAVLSALALAAAPTVAQETRSDNRVQTGRTTVQVETERQQPTARSASERGPAMRASDINGMNVRNQQNEDVGSVDDLVIDLETGKIRYAAVSVGGFLGVGDDLFAIPWNAFTLRKAEDDYHLVLNVTAEKFENAPGFDKDNWPNMADPQWRTTNDQFYIERGISTTTVRDRDVDVDVNRGTVGGRRDGVRVETNRQNGARVQTDRENGVRVQSDRQNGVRVQTDRETEADVRTDRQNGVRVDVDRPERTRPAASGTQPRSSDSQSDKPQSEQDKPQRDN